MVPLQALHVFFSRQQTSDFSFFPLTVEVERDVRDSLHRIVRRAVPEGSR